MTKLTKGMTKGKWYVDPLAREGTFLVRTTAEKLPIIDEQDHDSIVAVSYKPLDARLIAAAPEMYYLLKDLTKELRAYGDDVREDLYSLMIEAEEVLARIDGRRRKHDF